MLTELTKTGAENLMLRTLIDQLECELHSLRQIARLPEYSTLKEPQVIELNDRVLAQEIRIPLIGSFDVQADFQSPGFHVIVKLHNPNPKNPLVTTAGYYVSDTLLRGLHPVIVLSQFHLEFVQKLSKAYLQHKMETQKWEDNES